MKKIKPWMKIVLSIFIIIVFVGVGAFSYTYYQLSKIKTTEISKTDVDLGIKPTTVAKEEVNSEVINIALFGVDRRVANEPARSDSMIILSIDRKKKKIKMSSMMRDTYVKIKGHGQTKLTHAYAYGGPELAIRTLNENFNLNIRDYVTVDFSNFEKIIDVMGGITIDVQQDEIASIPQITKTGPQTLNGLQALAYSRLRYAAGDDFRRTERQRTVLSGMLVKIQSLGATEFPSVVSKLLPFTETSMNSMDLIKLGTKVIIANTKILEQARFPVDGYWSGKMIDKVWYLVADIKTTADQIHEFIYEDIKPLNKIP